MEFLIETYLKIHPVGAIHLLHWRLLPGQDFLVGQIWDEADQTPAPKRMCTGAAGADAMEEGALFV